MRFTVALLVVEYSSPGLTITSVTEGVIDFGIDICSEVTVKSPLTVTVWPLLVSFIVNLRCTSVSDSVLNAAVVIRSAEPDRL